MSSKAVMDVRMNIRKIYEWDHEAGEVVARYVVISNDREASGKYESYTDAEQYICTELARMFAPKVDEIVNGNRR